ncbi:hypothetical protein L1887_41925 [Cichorium endivia]|nr:hypothetical protein L1887_41925 [Cichorium endivia]
MLKSYLPQQLLISLFRKETDHYVIHHSVSLHTNRFEFKLEIAQNPLPLFPLGFFLQSFTKLEIVSPLNYSESSLLFFINALITFRFRFLSYDWKLNMIRLKSKIPQSQFTLTRTEFKVRAQLILVRILKFELAY